jgi:hypothetical protein
LNKVVLVDKGHLFVPADGGLLKTQLFGEQAKGARLKAKKTHTQAILYARPCAFSL